MGTALSSQVADKPPMRADFSLPIEKQRFKAGVGLEQTPTGNPQGKMLPQPHPGVHATSVALACNLVDPPPCVYSKPFR